MCTGKADPQQLYMGGKLKIAGNVMASMKLNFLKKIEPASVLAAMRARTSAAPSAAAPSAAAAAPAAPKTAQAPAVADRAAGKLSASKTDAAAVQLRVREPDSAWVLTLGPQGATLAAGEADKPSATVTLSDDDLAALARGQATARSLYQHGKLRVDGDARAAHHLSLLEGVL
jgi:3-hydroxyacyl-CoA dehydrogenase/3a,7a,12a-trihydroxy-5b-cholest-24-enoyl-CoA hydratase